MKNPITPNRLSIWLPVVLAALAMLFWPALATANCCCKRASLVTHENESDRPSCCQATKVSCCEASSQLAGESLSCDLQSQGCHCVFDCCKAYPSRLLTTIQDLDSQLIAFATAIPAFDSPYRTASIDDVPIPGSSFLSAQDHCARICRWLK